MIPEVSDFVIERRTALPSGMLDVVSDRTREYLRAGLGTLDVNLDNPNTTASAEERLRYSVESDIVELVSKIVNHCTAGDLGAAISLFSPGLFAELESLQVNGTVDRVIRSGFKYLVRATLKPSPFSTLTRVGYPGAKFDVSTCQVSVHFLHYLVQVMSTTPGLAPLFQYRKAEVFDDSILLRRWNDHRSGFRWYEIEPVPLNEIASDYNQLKEWNFGDWQSLRKLTAANDSRILRWIHMRLIEVVMPWELGGFSRTPIAELRTVLEKTMTRFPLQSLLAQLEDLVRQIPDSRPSRRFELSRSVTATSEQLLCSLNEPAVSTIPIFEDVSVQCTSASTYKPIQAVQIQSLRRFMFRSAQYEVIVNAFAKKYGVGAKVRNAREFFLWCAQDPDIQEALKVARGWDTTITSDTIPLELRDGKVGRTSAPPTVAMLYQHAEDDGGELVVANQFADGLGGLISRYAVLDADSDGGVRRGVRQWVKGRFADDVQVLEFIPGAEGNTAQFLSQGSLPRLRWRRGETVDAEFTFDELELRHDRKKNVLDFSYRGRDCAPVYLGLLPYWQVRGAAGIACLLMNPWLDRTPTSVLAHPLYRQTTAEQVSHMRRLVVEDVVLVRETWHVYTDTIPFRERYESVERYLCRVENWRDSLGVPAEAFYLPIDHAGSTRITTKPFWVDFNSPIALDVMAAEIRASHMVRFQEVLPRRRAQEATSELISLIAWERP